MTIQISFIALICIIVIYLAFKDYYKIPDIEKLRKMISDTNIESISITSIFFKTKKIEISNQREIPNVLVLPDKVKIPKPIQEVKSKWIGTFYLMNEENNQPYVKLGQIIKPGDCVGHIISMNLKTEVISEISGKIVGLAIGNNNPIDYGRTIMYVEEL